MENYIILSIETHLFFARIMREHALFLEAGFPCKEKDWIKKADWFREQFEDLLRDTLSISNGNINRCVVESNELATEFTIPAEKRTAKLSGIPIDSQLSILALNLKPIGKNENFRRLTPTVNRLNQTDLRTINVFPKYLAVRYTAILPRQFLRRIPAKESHLPHNDA